MQLITDRPLWLNERFTKGGLEAWQQNKEEVIEYFRRRVRAVRRDSAAINRASAEERKRLVNLLRSDVRKGGLTRAEYTSSALAITYAADIAMIEARNRVRPYEYMDFSRRMGELWEGVCRLPFAKPLRTDVEKLSAPSFAPLHEQLRTTFDVPSCEAIGPGGLAPLHGKLVDWMLDFVGVSDVEMGLDLHLRIVDEVIAVDFKSGFGSNEKGNTSRLLQVGQAYRLATSLGGSLRYRCVLLVRAEEEDGNHYLQKLKGSNLWDVYCGREAYETIREFSGFDLRGWIDSAVDWASDLCPNTAAHLRNADLLKYTVW